MSLNIESIDPSAKPQAPDASPNPTLTRKSPYPGLRSFTHEDTDIFFGREGQVDTLIARLGGSHFLAVVGTSGSGKSSLVRAGLLPALWGGYLQPTGAEWCVADFTPGSNPVSRLAEALTQSEFFGRAIAATELLESPRRLRQLIEAAIKSRQSNLLILADQFEELFRFAPSGKTVAEYRDEQATFVKALLDVSCNTSLPVRVVITMRADFIGDCAQFRDLPEAVSNGQHLIPRTTREQRRSIIEGPARVAGSSMSNRLVQRLLNDAGDDPDQLPVLQHALMRTWQRWQSENTARPIDLEDYEAIGTLTNALSLHADEALAAAAKAVPKGAQIAQRVFQRLRDRDSGGREVRVPTSRGVLADVAGVTLGEIDRCVHEFQAPGRAFVRVSKDGKVDVAHECLLRQWKTLAQDWVNEELESKRRYLRLVDRSEDGQPLGDAILQLTLAWWEKRKPTPEWAARYDPRFAQVETFLRRSQKENVLRHEEERKQQIAAEAARRHDLSLRWGIALLCGALIATGALYLLYERERAAHNHAERARKQADADRRNAITQMMTSKASAKSGDKSAAVVAALLAATSFKRDPAPDTQLVLSASLSTLPALVTTPSLPISVEQFDYDNDGHFALAGEQKLVLLDVTTGETSHEVALPPGPAIAISWGVAGRKIGVLTRDAGRIFDSQAPEVNPFNFDCTGGAYFSMADDASLAIAMCGGRAKIFVRELKAGQNTYRERVVDHGNDHELGWVVSGDGSTIGRVAVIQGREVYQLGNLKDPKAKGVYPLPHFESLNAARDDPSIMGWYEFGSSIWSDVVLRPEGALSSGSPEARAGEGSSRLEAVGTVVAFSFSNVGDLVLGVAEGGVLQAWDRETTRETLRTHVAWGLVESQTAKSASVGISRNGLIGANDKRGQLTLVTPTPAQWLRLKQPLVSSSGDGWVGVQPHVGVVAVAPRSPRDIEKYHTSASIRLFFPGDSRDFGIPLVASTAGSSLIFRSSGSTLRAYRNDSSRVLELGSPSHLEGIQLSADGLWCGVKVARGSDVGGSNLRNAGRAGNVASPDSGNRRSSLGLFSTDGNSETAIEWTELTDAANPESVGSWALTGSGADVFAVADADKANVMRRRFSRPSAWQTTRIACEKACSLMVTNFDGRTLATAEPNPSCGASSMGQSCVKVWKQEQCVATLPHEGPVQVMALSRDGRRLATADTAALHVWDTETGKEVASFAPIETIRDLQFSPDGKAVLAAGIERVESFTIDPEDVLAEVCRRTGRDLTHEEWQNLVPGEPYTPICHPSSQAKTPEAPKGR